MPDLRGQRFSVLGLARTGLAAANYLARHGADVVASDLREPFDLRLDDIEPAVDVRAAQNYVRPGDTVVISPGIKPHTSAWNLAHDQGGEVISDIELFGRLAPCPVVAVTGTDGKSTTTALIGALLEATGRRVFVGGNIGRACMSGLDGLDADAVTVLEVSCFQLTHCFDFCPDVAVVTNIAEDHVEYHGSMAAYIAAKKRLFRNMGPGRRLVVNGDDPEVSSWDLPAGVEVRRFGWQAGRDARADATATWVDGELLLPHADVKLQGLHNLENVMAAVLAVAGRFAPVDALRPTLRTFAGLEHRMEFVGEVAGVSFFNDSKATNPHAAMAVLEAFADPFWLLAGGYEKGSDFADLGQAIARRTKGAILYGATRERLAAAIPGDHTVHRVETLADATALGAKLAGRGDRVILAPACASFDQFKDYEERGRVFKELVRQLQGES